MKYFVTIFIVLSTVFVATAQTYEIGVMAGGANYIGDIGKTDYINPSNLALGGVIKWNRSNRHAFRASATIAKIKGDDAASDNSRREERGYTFQNVIKELSLGIEYTFWDFNVHGQEFISTPYLYTGLTAFGYSALYKDNDNIIRKYDDAISFAIPMVVGYKANMGRNAMIGFEVGARYTFTDNLDGSNPGQGKADDESLKFGNVNSNDWYVFTGITVTFAFGRKPCYCNF
ncbi:type IX secretion system protein PorG [Aequorivita viscosa]|uniref:DUF6089 domain-containing protein n=1 Tax=Aequorivita viscosa TaxID=797419 RepID=A0A1M6AB11_9FLAO|nr:DUF6089 family protein [Aequorivita viscosa]SDW13528.1 hypothetical protein SAMN05216556_102124 [Aequorivita viscosa]SHI33363.1 hypothetical protein SAMN04487908_101123 [Aequorivita viscosa]